MCYGSPYTALETRRFATQLGLVPCFTPVASPQSNGICEAFVKTFKRDYVRINPLPSARQALAQIAGWFEDLYEFVSVKACISSLLCSAIWLHSHIRL